MTMTQEQEFNPGFSMDGPSGGGGGFDREKIKGLTHLRILPPYGTNNNRALFHKYSRHWGFQGENGQTFPVACSYPTERFCPVCQKVKDVEGELKRIMGAFTKIEDLPADQQKAAKELDDYIYKYRCENVWVYNAATLDGRAVALELKWTSHKNLWGDDKKFLGRIKEVVNKYQIDPTSVRTGVWFTFDKSGTGLNTAYPVEIKKIVKVVAGEQAEVNDRTPLPDTLIEAIEAQLKAAGPNGVAPGPLTDIHTLMDPMTAAQLGAILKGAPIPKRKRAGETTTSQAFIPPVEEPQGAQAAEKAASEPPKTEEKKEEKPAHQHNHAASTTSPPAASAPAASAPAANVPTAPQTGGLAAEVARLRALAQQHKKPATAPAAAS